MYDAMDRVQNILRWIAFLANSVFNFLVSCIHTGSSETEPKGQLIPPKGPCSVLPPAPRQDGATSLSGAARNQGRIRDIEPAVAEPPE